MITPAFLTTAEQMDEARRNHERDTRPGNPDLLSHTIHESGQSPHKRIGVTFMYADGTWDDYGPIGAREYDWTRTPA